ncbi:MULTISPECIES: hypothetical protein [unclassified Streptomyces]|uniref:hypothetical protein n=1 Tax=unclassified Streptomyces TaxID=2593676 RepID=UPI00136C3BA8|nr:MULTISPECIES: hypothetical protein [unclassified Streptomyces]NEA01763.1 hypothetical protein [Streptomyces sp. SID10116]MYY82186.1 hypothetical protein [Streptomyces sp. SID335]MYZ12637.1 hypothetical protein [Streptomyces sp. SID337]NDZ90749.1 hypothetical protein [Streptomyces sp. SID10115]NEB46671.1 hypothetical protein [Streptomyces sp. SID339]
MLTSARTTRTFRRHGIALGGLAALDTDEADAHVLTYCRTKGLATEEARAAVRTIADRRSARSA